MTRDQSDRLVTGHQPWRRTLAEAERQKRKGINRRGYNPRFGFLDHRHRVLAAVLSHHNTVALTLAARLLGRDRNTLSYHTHRTMPLLAFTAPDPPWLKAPTVRATAGGMSRHPVGGSAPVLLGR